MLGGAIMNFWNWRKKEKSISRQGSSEIITDPFGSYTGRTLDPDEKPVQDADDL